MQSITKVFSEIVKPYIDSVKNDIMDLLSEVGAVNMLPITVSSQVINGVTYTVNSDGTISAHTSGQTITQNAQLVQDVTLPSGTYRQIGCPSGGSDSTYRIGGFDGNDYGNGRLITSAGTTRQLYFTVFSGMNIPANNPIVFKPMISPVEYTGPYVPYAKSNKELTDDVIRLDGEAVKIVDSGLIDANSSHSFTCTNFEGYRLSIFSIGTDSIGSVVLFGKHPSVSDIKYSKFDCINPGANSPQISVSGATLTITTTTVNCYYTIERIRNT